jgi:hypothetical protein
VLAEQSVTVGAIVLSHIEWRATKWYEAAWPTAEKKKSRVIFFTYYLTFI